MPGVRLDLDDGVAVITLVDPGGVNTLDPARVARLRELVGEADAAPGIGAILLRAEGQAFCAGADLGWLASGPERVSDDILGLADDVVALVGTLTTTPRITVAAVHGAVAGGGLGLALACDVVVAAADTTFAVAYNRIGACPDLGVSAFLRRDLGYRRALELCLLRDQLTAAEAVALGLVTRIVAPAALDTAARALAQRIASGPRAANAATKRLLRASPPADLATHLVDELRSVASLSLTPGWAEGTRAFIERRNPAFG